MAMLTLFLPGQLRSCHSNGFVGLSLEKGSNIHMEQNVPHKEVLLAIAVWRPQIGDDKKQLQYPNKGN